MHLPGPLYPNLGVPVPPEVMLLKWVRRVISILSPAMPLSFVADFILESSVDRP